MPRMTRLDAYRSWLILHRLPDIGRGRLNALVRRFGSPDNVLSVSRETLLEVEGIGTMAADSILNWREYADVDAELERIEAHGVSLVSILDETYPANLARMACPPPLLYYQGALSPVDEAAVAVIGARKMSRYGREAAETIARELAQAGVTVVSGLAIGIDSVAHRAALDAGGRTFAVMGCGLASVYPAQHRALADEIVAHGAVISEMPMDALPDAGSFPQRNAIIAGLSLGVLVVEAGATSGTQITVGHALDEGRSVFAVPGDIGRANSVGTNRLIQEGARLATSGRDVLLDLHAELRGLLTNLPALEDPSPGALPEVPKDLSDAERAVYEALQLDPLTIDAITETLGAAAPAIGETMSSLLSLELRGLIRQEPGKTFRRLR
ncbi:DNA-processing protein DprA [Candidatus Sumerlaeota bacterium]|nr:DNA-processing protein DprA [Candidatus Sumerlaeota bacterium]